MNMKTACVLSVLLVVGSLVKDRPVLFHAVKSTTSSYQGNKVIIYDKIINNYGHAYNGNNGIFTAPVKGVYSFTVQASSAPGKGLHIALVRNDIVVGKGWTYGDVATITRPVLLKARDRVLVWHYRNTRENVYGGWSQFSGTLMRPLK